MDIWPRPPRKPQRRRLRLRPALATDVAGEAESSDVSDEGPDSGAELSEDDPPDEHAVLEVDELLERLGDIAGDVSLDELVVAEDKGEPPPLAARPAACAGAHADAPAPATPPRLASGSGAASSSGPVAFEPPPPAPLPIPDEHHGPAGRGVALRRGKAAATVVLEGGVLSYYTSNAVFQATCRNPFHGACVLTRKRSVLAQLRGRPCGLMAAWLALGPRCETKAAHWELLSELETDEEMVGALRDVLRSSEDGRAVLAQELPP